MTKENAILISRYMKDGSGYRKIAAELDLPLGTVKSWCRRHPYTESAKDRCPACGKRITSIPHKKPRRFCSDKCRNRWWSAHPELRNTKTEYSHVCRQCGRDFKNDRRQAGYCCRECFAEARRKKA